MSDDDLHCWRVSGPISGVSGQYPVEAEYDSLFSYGKLRLSGLFQRPRNPNQEVTILFW